MSECEIKNTIFHSKNGQTHFCQFEKLYLKYSMPLVHYYCVPLFTLKECLGWFWWFTSKLCFLYQTQNIAKNFPFFNEFLDACFDRIFAISSLSKFWFFLQKIIKLKIFDDILNLKGFFDLLYNCWMSLRWWETKINCKSNFNWNFIMERKKLFQELSLTSYRILHFTMQLAVVRYFWFPFCLWSLLSCRNLFGNY